jgi:hypothetical protein
VDDQSRKIAAPLRIVRDCVDCDCRVMTSAGECPLCGGKNFRVRSVTPETKSGGFVTGRFTLIAGAILVVSVVVLIGLLRSHWSAGGQKQLWMPLFFIGVVIAALGFASGDHESSGIGGAIALLLTVCGFIAFCAACFAEFAGGIGP